MFALCFLLLYSFGSSPEDLLLILERGKAGRAIDQREREHGLAAFCACPDPELNLKPRSVPGLGLEPTTFLCMG